MLPLNGMPEEILSQLTELTSDIINHPPVSAFCIGRTSDIWQAKNRHGCKHIFALYSTNDSRDAVLVEDALEKALAGHGKYYGDVEYDAASEEEHACFVYLAVWLEGSSSRVPVV